MTYDSFVTEFILRKVVRKNQYSLSLASLVLTGAFLFSTSSEQHQEEAKSLLEQVKEKAKEKGDGGE